MKDKKQIKDKYLTFTKRLIILILYLSIIWVSWSYVLATIALFKYGDTNALTDVSTEVIRVLMASILGYLLKAYFETREQERQRIIEKRLDYKMQMYNNEEEQEPCQNQTDIDIDSDKF